MKVIEDKFLEKWYEVKSFDLLKEHIKGFKNKCSLILYISNDTLHLYQHTSFIEKDTSKSIGTVSWLFSFCSTRLYVDKDGILGTEEFDFDYFYKFLPTFFEETLRELKKI